MLDAVQPPIKLEFVNNWFSKVNFNADPSKSSFIYKFATNINLNVFTTHRSYNI